MGVRGGRGGGRALERGGFIPPQLTFLSSSEARVPAYWGLPKAVPLSQMHTVIS